MWKIIKVFIWLVVVINVACAGFNFWLVIYNEAGVLNTFVGVINSIVAVFATILTFAIPKDEKVG